MRAGYGCGMRLGVLDVGSNSAQLQVVEAYPGAPPLPMHAIKVPTLLGQAFDASGAIDASGVRRVVDAVVEAAEGARRLSVERLYAFATAAVRDAANRRTVLDAVEREAGVALQWLSGEEEARLTYLAVHRWYGWSSGRLLVIDIGGGSMEIALGRDAEPDLALSLPLGAGRLTREHLPEDPPSNTQLKALRRHVRDTLREVSDRLRWEGVPRHVIGTSKTFKQLARLSGAPAQRAGPFADRRLATADLASQVRQLARCSAKQRAKLRGVSRPRAGQILAGAVIAEATMNALGIPGLQICPWALREGIMLHHQATLERQWELPLQPILPPAKQHTARVYPMPDQGRAEQRGD